MGFGDLPAMDVIDRTIAALRGKGYNVMFAENGREAKAKAIDLIPPGVEVMNTTSMTLSAVSMADEVLNSGRYQSVRQTWKAMNNRVKDIHRCEVVQDWVIGSMHALTEDGVLMVASKTGSQLGSYAYGAFHVLWVIGAQKIVKDVNEGFKRIFEHSLPLEVARAQEAYGTGSSVGKVLIFYQEAVKERINIILVNEALGF